MDSDPGNDADRNSGVFRPEFVRFAIKAVSAANIGAVFFAFASSVGAPVLKAFVLFGIAAYLSMFGEMRRFLAPAAVLLLLFVFVKWLGMDIPAVWSR